MTEIIIGVVSIVLTLITLGLVIYLLSRSKRTTNIDGTEVDLTSINKVIEEGLNKVNSANTDILLKVKGILNDSSNGLTEDINNIKEKLIEQLGKIKENNEQFKASVTQSFNKLTEDVNSKIDTKFNSTNEGVEKLKTSIQTEMNEFKKDSNEEFRKNYSLLIEQVNTQLNNINIAVNKKIGEGFENNTKSLSQVSESLGKISEAQKNLDKLSDEVSSLNNVLTNSQTRGRFGEVVLESILHDVFGDTKGNYELQATIKNKGREVRPDALIYLPEPDKRLCIDSKFSFVDYKALIESKDEDKDLKKKFRDALKGEIDKIRDNYIIEGETAYYAIMFIPNDGIYTYLQTDDYFYNSVIDYARTSNVIICSPSTLQPILANVRMLKVNFEIAKNIKNVVSGINELGKETLRLSDRWEDVMKSTERLSKDQQKLSTTIDKITKKSTAIVSKAKKDNLVDDKDLIEEGE